MPSIPRYLVSSHGNVRFHLSSRNRKAQILNGGYSFISIRTNGRSFPYSAHALVAEAFIGHRPKGKAIRHLDGNPGNNHYKNLKYGTPKENGEDMVKHKRSRRGQSNGNAKAKDRDVKKMRDIYAARLMDQRAIAREFGISQAQVNNILLYKQRQNNAFRM